MQTAWLIRGRVIYVSPERMLVARVGRLLESRDDGVTWKLIGLLPVSFSEKMAMASGLMGRLLRKGVHHYAAGNLYALIVANRAVYAMGEGAIKQLGPVHGSRPLALCAANGAFYYGEYCANAERLPVHIWKLGENRRQWEIAWRFSGVRHVHGVFYDPYENGLWVTTGDRDHEAGIWRTDDDFATLQKVVGGSQRCRAVQLLFTRDFVYFGSDAPDEKNHIYRMPRDGGVPEKLTAVGSSVFYGCKVGDSLFFSTAVEPSSVNPTRSAEVWRSDDGVNWYKILEFKKDRWSRKYFQYGQVLFPSGPGDKKHLYITPFATEEHGKTLVYRIA